MTEKKLPIKLFSKRSVDEMRVEGGGSRETPKWVLEGEELLERLTFLDNSLNEIRELFENQSAAKKTPFVFKTVINSEATAKSRRSPIVSLFISKGTSNVLGFAGQNELLVKVESKELLNEVLLSLHDTSKSKYALSCIEDFLPYTPNFFLSEDEINYKLKLLDFQKYETNEIAQRELESFLINEELKYVKTVYSDTLSVYKLMNIDKNKIGKLKNSYIFDSLFSIEPMPKYSVVMDLIADENIVSVRNPTLNQNYVTVGILDTGISKIPHLKPWLVEEKYTAYPDEYVDKSHGTFTAGVALYGDDLENSNWIGHGKFKILDATIYPDCSKESIEEDELICNIRNAISLHYKNVKIWNLSASIAREISDEKYSDFAIALDDIQDKYNILICKSAGNCTNFVVNKEKGRIHEGADSIRSLVVGSLAHSKGDYNLSEVNNPSPFSRIGPGPEFIIKPEVSHYGGNAGVEPTGKLITEGVKSFSIDGSYSKSVGTSFSTPRVTSLVAGLFQSMEEEFDPLLLKALVIHSASYGSELKIPEAERTRHLGFGLPRNINEILYNDEHEVTLVLRDSMVNGEYVDIMDFPVPSTMVKDGFYTGQIVVTLVYDPVLDYTQGAEYCQSNIDIKFGTYDCKEDRDTTRQHVLNPVGRKDSENVLLKAFYSKRKMKSNYDQFALKERMLIQYGDKYYPVKKYAADLSDVTDITKQKYLASDRKWYLYLRSLFREHSVRKSSENYEQLSQEYCLIITIKDPTRQINVYDDVVRELDAHQFWHNSIKLRDEVSVQIETENK